LARAASAWRPDIVTVDIGAEARAPQLPDATAEARSPDAGGCMNTLLLYALAVMSRREAFQLDHDGQRTMARVA
jgi:hypothetical protein